MHDKGPRALHVVHDRIREERRARGTGEALAEQKIAVSTLQIDLRARCGQRGERARDAGGERLAQLVVAEPGVEEIADHVERGRAVRGPCDESVQRFDECRPLPRQMQVGDEERRRHRHVSALPVYSLISARSITTSSLGTS